MILVGQYDSPFVRRVGIALQLYGMSFTRNTISVFSNAEEMARINPLVRIPSLVLDDGEVMIDSVVILDHLDELAGAERALLPRSGAERRRQLQIIAMALGTIDKAGAVVYERFFHDAGRVNDELVARYKTQLSGGLAWLEERIPTEYFAGKRIGHADIAVGVLAGYLNLRLTEAWDRGFPKLQRFAARLEEMEPFKSTRPAADEVMKPLKR